MKISGTNNLFAYFKAKQAVSKNELEDFEPLKKKFL